MAKEKLKIRPECLSCMYLSGNTPESVVCSKGNVPTCYRKKKPCCDFLEKKAATNDVDNAQGTDNTKPFESENRSCHPTQPEKMVSDCVKAPVNKVESAVAYTDGSFNKKTNTWGYGVCMFVGDERIELTGSGEDIYGGWQVLGEISGALAACEKAVELGVKSLEIKYDYEGIFHWAVNNWQATKPYTIEYAEKMKQYMKRINITFTHVKAHTGVDGNENADVLAKKACGVYVPFTANGYLPSIPMGVNSKCRKCIKEFYRKKIRSSAIISTLKRMVLTLTQGSHTKNYRIMLRERGSLKWPKNLFRTENRFVRV